MTDCFTLVAGLLVLQHLLLVFFLKVNWKNHVRNRNQTPKVSVLVAARNEEVDLPLLLKSFDNLDYPIDQIEFLIADDQSVDQTSQIIIDWALRGINRKFISVQSEQKNLIQKNGKANALAIICQQASGEFFFFTDADCEVPAKWIREGIDCFDDSTGLVLGITQVKNRTIFGKMQEIDWWNTLGIVKVVADFKLPTTGLGNNMVISREAYEKSGGFEGIPFSLTEDLELSRAISQLGLEIKHQVSENLLVKTKSEQDWKSLLSQRKRWTAGAMTLAIPWKILIGFQILYYPAILALIGLRMDVGLIIFGFKILAQSIFLSIFAKKAGQILRVPALLLFEFYQFWNLSLTILYYFWPGQIEWKARRYP
jgi:cellulose synthase/poly-beta-1,6-N-acetylglucosamine synthase-like glycosyltransferase